jgi:hypothetical protein
MDMPNVGEKKIEKNPRASKGNEERDGKHVSIRIISQCVCQRIKDISHENPLRRS